MSSFSSALSSAISVMQIDLNVGGFSFSFWDVFLWQLLAVAVGCMIVRFLMR